MSRGMITESVLDIAKETLGKEISQKELRLMPYIFTCAIDGQNEMLMFEKSITTSGKS